MGLQSRCKFAAKPAHAPALVTGAPGHLPRLGSAQHTRQPLRAHVFQEHAGTVQCLTAGRLLLLEPVRRGAGQQQEPRKTGARGKGARRRGSGGVAPPAAISAWGCCRKRRLCWRSRSLRQRRNTLWVRTSRATSHWVRGDRGTEGMSTFPDRPKATGVSLGVCRMPPEKTRLLSLQNQELICTVSHIRPLPLWRGATPASPSGAPRAL